MLNETYRGMLAHKSVIRETFMYGKQRAAQIGYENVFDYSLGNPSVPCPERFTAAMQELLAQEDPVALHGYCPSQGDPEFRTAVAAHLNRTFGLPYAQKDIFPTTGAAGAIAHAVRAVTRPGDEVLTFAPYFPEYGPYVAGTGAVLRVVPPQAPTFQPNLDAFAQMLTEKVTCVLINTPNNPTGVVYSADTLTRMAAILTEKSAQYGHNIFLVSDEPYRDIVFDGKAVPYPAAFYPHTLTCFSYSKSLSLPGERLGYVAVRPGCEGEDILVDMMSQISRFTGHNCPPSIIQRAVSRCLNVTSDLSVYETNMNLLYDKLKALGFEVERPGGTFYIFPKALEEDANAFCLRARAYDLLLPLEKRVQTWLDTPAGHLDLPLVSEDHLKAALNGSHLANFINTVQLEASGAQIASSALPNEFKGLPTEVTIRDVVSTYIYTNTLVVLEMTRPALKQYIERSAAYFDHDEDGNLCIADEFLRPKVQHYNYDFFSGIHYTIDARNPVGQRVTSIVLDGRELGEDEPVTVCVNSYRFCGTGGYDMLPRQKVAREVLTDVADAMIDYITSHPNIRVDTEKYCTVIG